MDISQDKSTQNGCKEKEGNKIVDEEKNTGNDLSPNDKDVGGKRIIAISLGTKIVKSFLDYGEFKGVVTRIPTDEEPFYRVQYEDGDEEDMSGDEIEKYVKASK
eukprot:6188626-Ditylum_brightwellii.AAC.1